MQNRTLDGFLILDDLLISVTGGQTASLNDHFLGILILELFLFKLGKRNEITGENTNTARLPFDLKALYEFAKDLAEILKDGTIMEQKAILRSFVKRIIINPRPT
ncbi:MAG: hypothetical protein BWZ03_00291 [bacterium ADurb.BinA186]|nr:MAG: hypothetical protein BWZ03_00291 [bacterium ADurb.BinA186]